MNDIRSYILLNRKTNFIIKLFIIISIIMFITALVISQFKYEKYLKLIGQVVVEEKNYKLSLYLNPYQLDIIKKNNKLVIDNLEYIYSIDYIASGYIITDNCNNCLNVVLDINLKKKDEIVNNVLQVKVLESNEKLFYYLKRYFKKGDS